MRDVDGIKAFQHGDDVRDCGRKSCGVVFRAKGDVRPYTELLERFGISSDMNGCGPTIKSICQKGLEGTRFSEHAAVVIMLRIATAACMCALNVMVVRDEGEAHSM